MDETRWQPMELGNVTYNMSATNQTGSSTPDVRLAYEEYDTWLELATASYYLDKRYLWFICAFGFPGNIATIITISRDDCLSTASLYVLLLAVVDDLALVIKLLYHQLAMYSFQIGAPGCKMLKFLGSFLVAFANWILVTLAVERFVAIHFPFSQRDTRKSRLKKALLIISMEACGLCCVFSPILWMHSFIYDASIGTMRCGEPAQYLHFVHKVWHWIDSAVYAVIPCICLSTLNVLIIRDTTRSLKTLTLLASTGSCRRRSNNVQLTLMLVTASIVFVILTLPVCVYYVVEVYWQVDPYTTQQGWKYLLRDIAYLLCDVSHAVNFYLYFLSARNFRRRFLKLCACNVHHPESQQTLSYGASSTPMESMSTRRK